ncbi:MAG TPA: ABC transporter ATP-binding protein, partial [Terriglobales bacterium]
LDVETVEWLEGYLQDEHEGAIVLITHDRYLLDRVSTTVLGLDGEGGAEVFADYRQWEQWVEQRAISDRTSESKPATAKPEASKPKKLSYLEQREYSNIEERIANAENHLAATTAAFHDPAIATDGARLIAAQHAMEQARSEVDALYARWSELEAKVSGG